VYYGRLKWARKSTKYFGATESCVKNTKGDTMWLDLGFCPHLQLDGQEVTPLARKLTEDMTAYTYLLSDGREVDGRELKLVVEEFKYDSE
jgi:hypothetical protein